jgi:hypothetical protein
VFAGLKKYFDISYASVERAGEIDCGDCMPYENHLQIFVCRRQRAPLAARWASLKHYE